MIAIQFYRCWFLITAFQLLHRHFLNNYEGSQFLEAERPLPLILVTYRSAHSHGQWQQYQAHWHTRTDDRDGYQRYFDRTIPLPFIPQYPRFPNLCMMITRALAVPRFLMHGSLSYFFHSLTIYYLSNLFHILFLFFLLVAATYIIIRKSTFSCSIFYTHHFQRLPDSCKLRQIRHQWQYHCDNLDKTARNQNYASLEIVKLEKKNES